MLIWPTSSNSKLDAIAFQNGTGHVALLHILSDSPFGHGHWTWVPHSINRSKGKWKETKESAHLHLDSDPWKEWQIFLGQWDKVVKKPDILNLVPQSSQLWSRNQQEYNCHKPLVVVQSRANGQ